MRGILFAVLIFWSVIIGGLWTSYHIGTLQHANDYSRGYDAGFVDGYRTPHRATREDAVVGNLLCHYAELACVRPKK
jgi:hypothetical protein